MSPAEFAIHTVMRKFAGAEPEIMTDLKPAIGKKKPKSDGPATGARSPLEPFVRPLIAGSLGSLGLANMIASGKHIETMRKSLATSGQPLNAGETANTRYLDILSPGSAITPFGVSISNAMPYLRANNSFMKLVGMDTSPPVEGQTMESAGHYAEYAKGPLSAYQHRLDTSRGNEPLDPAFVAANFAEDAVKPKTHSDLFRIRFRDFLRSKSGIAGGSGELLPNDISYDNMSHERQMQLMRAFDQSLPPAMQAERHRIETGVWNKDNSLLNQAKNYTGVMGAGIKAHDTLMSAGATLGGAAAGGMAGHYLHRLLGGDPKKRSLSLLASELGGAAVGGMGGYVAAHPEQNFNKLLEGIMAAKNMTQKGFNSIKSAEAEQLATPDQIVKLAANPAVPAPIPNPYHATRTVSPAAILEHPAMDQLQANLHAGPHGPRESLLYDIQNQSPGGPSGSLPVSSRSSTTRP